MKKHTPLEKKLLDTLLEITEQADQDCPSEYRTKHFRAAIQDSVALLKKIGWIS